MEVTQNPSSQQIIFAAKNMPLNELEQLIGNVLAVRAERIAPHISGEESKLLKNIEKTFSKKSLSRMKKLQVLRDEGRLSSEGFKELAELIEKLEEFHAERMKSVAALADIRGITFPAALKQVGLRLPDYE